MARRNNGDENHTEEVPIPDVWTERMKAFGIAVAAVSGLIAALGSFINHSKLDNVEQHQEVNTIKIDDATKAAIDAKAKADTIAVKQDTTAAKLSSIERTVKTIAEQ